MYLFLYSALHFLIAVVNFHSSVLFYISSNSMFYSILLYILQVNDAKKDTSSTAGMGASVATSPLLLLRAKHVVDGRMAAIEKAFKVGVYV